LLDNPEMAEKIEAQIRAKIKALQNPMEEIDEKIESPKAEKVEKVEKAEKLEKANKSLSPN
jgi:FtsZ-binding cell division protein ZapB